ncbi:collagen alpha-2(VIII) chain-like [Centropristis striata]|uniref:collagen alpha-2(VIII) chain-like n=1 Tax=Centropristis striata TaxID=184440 RepID=UPI0027DED1A9|nr:collagen alpha-2(VIII) chain-like [Centropristis striata]
MTSVRAQKDLDSTWKMNLTILLLVSLFSGFILAQEEVEAPTEAQPCHPDMCELLKELGTLREKLEAVETRLTDSENKEKTKVIFSAATGGSRAIGPFDADSTLIYKTVITNIGEAYSPVTGTFVAPVAGVYYFTMFYHAGGAHEGKLLLYKNTQLMIMTHDKRSEFDGADNGGNAAFLELQPGDEVYVRMAANSHVWGTDYHTTFSGFLVAQM